MESGYTRLDLTETEEIQKNKKIISIISSQSLLVNLCGWKDDEDVKWSVIDRLGLDVIFSILYANCWAILHWPGRLMIELSNNHPVCVIHQ